MCEKLRSLSQTIDEPTQGFNMAEQNIESILTKICHNAWEKEVTAKKSQHSVKWVFSQAADSYFINPDSDKLNTQYDDDGDEEPVGSPLLFYS